MGRDATQTGPSGFLGLVIHMARVSTASSQLAVGLLLLWEGESHPEVIGWPRSGPVTGCTRAQGEDRRMRIPDMGALNFLHSVFEPAQRKRAIIP
jgi:hypothetical protein